MSSCKGKSPLQMFTKGRQQQQQLVADNLLGQVNSDYGFDDAVVPHCPVEPSVLISTPKVPNPLSVADYATLQSLFNPLEYSSSCNGIDLYANVQSFVN